MYALIQKWALNNKIDVSHDQLRALESLVEEKSTPTNKQIKPLLDELDGYIEKGAGILGYLGRIKEISQQIRECK